MSQPPISGAPPQQQRINSAPLPQQQQQAPSKIVSQIPQISNQQQRKEIYTYEAPWMVYAMSWSNRKDKKFRLALGSYQEEYVNKIDIVALNDEKQQFERQFAFDHPYPATKIMWYPDTTSSSNVPDMLATSGDILRLWQLGERGVQKKSELNTVCKICAKRVFFK